VPNKFLTVHMYVHWELFLMFFVLQGSKLYPNTNIIRKVD